MLAGISAAKVFSAQYIIWVIPLFALLAYGNKRARIIGAVFAAVCLFTAAIPEYYFTEFIHHPMKLPDGSVLWAAPTPAAVSILLSRNLMLVALTIMLIYSALPGHRFEPQARRT